MQVEKIYELLLSQGDVRNPTQRRKSSSMATSMAPATRMASAPHDEDAIAPGFLAAFGD